jgi:hypothetical protein
VANVTAIAAVSEPSVPTTMCENTVSHLNVCRGASVPISTDCTLRVLVCLAQMLAAGPQVNGFGKESTCVPEREKGPSGLSRNAD